MSKVLETTSRWSLVRRAACGLVGAAVLGSSSPSPAPAAADVPGTETVTVPATANIFGAGLSTAPTLPGDDEHGPGGGWLPVGVPVVGRTAVSFPSLSGTITCVYISDYPQWFNGPEGTCFGGTDTNLTPIPGGSVSGIVAAGTNMFLVGVFTGSTAPAGAPPAALDFSTSGLGTTFSSLSPALNQAFFIGDGRVSSNGALQRFIAPVGATTLHLGFADGFNFQGMPSYYNDNLGALGVSVETVFTLLDELATSVSRLGARGSLAYRVTAIRAAVDAGKLRDACTGLKAFVTDVNGQSGKTLDPTVAAELILSATHITSVIGC